MKRKLNATFFSKLVLKSRNPGNLLQFSHFLVPPEEKINKKKQLNLYLLLFQTTSSGNSGVMKYFTSKTIFCNISFKYTLKYRKSCAELK